MLRNLIIPATLVLLAAIAARADAEATVNAAKFPAWAYAWDPQFEPQPATDVPRRVPDSTATFSVAQARDLFFSPDWHPNSHPVMPAVVARGATLVMSGSAGNALPCAGCHGANLRGFAAAPGIAGRSPSYIVRQLYDYQSGARAGAGSALMRPVVVKFTESDMIAVAAYLGALRGSKLP